MKRSTSTSLQLAVTSLKWASHEEKAAMLWPGPMFRLSSIGNNCTTEALSNVSLKPQGNHLLVNCNTEY